MLFEALPPSSPPGAKELAMARRLEIALDVALGLAYLHAAQPAVIHRDVKGCVLLDTIGP